ncbi:hypothetical protein F4815DRAFT_464535 [Daldinia loculata]|nr:hypothetical protein F4815DRAFT_464535 [Daldinia loculata]
MLAKLRIPAPSLFTSKPFRLLFTGIPSSTWGCCYYSAGGTNMALPFPQPSDLLPEGFVMARCAPGDTPGMTSVCEFFIYIYIFFFIKYAFKT